MYARSKTPSMGTPSVYSIHASHLTLRSSNLRSTRSMKSLRVPWYQRPILKDAYFLDTQRGALVIAFYSLFLSIFTLVTSAFDTYCLAMAAPGSTHYGYYVMSYQFVYVGSAWGSSKKTFVQIMVKNIWDIVEYDDHGIQIVPDNWVSADGKSCYWPPSGVFKSNKAYLKTVEKCVLAPPTWPTFKVISILGKYDNFEKTLRKLKKAEDQTDITTDADKDKKSRKIRRKKKYSSTDESSTEENNSTKRINVKPLPEPPVSKEELCKPSTYRINSTTNKSTSPSPTCRQIPWTSMLDDSSNSSDSLSTSLQDGPFDNSNDVLNTVFSTPRVKTNVALKCSKQDSTIPENKNRVNNLSDRDFKNMVLRQLAVIKVNIKKLDDRLKNQSLINSNSNSSLARSPEEYDFNDIFDEFPIKTEESLKKIEFALKDKTYKLNLTVALSKLGGSKTDEATKFILRKLFIDKLAMEYSWCGGKGKRIMSNLLISRVIIDSVFKIVKTTTEDEIVKSIKNWMRHAKKRNENSEKRAADSTEQVNHIPPLQNAD